ncbi:MAG: GAF domain-containing protein [Candidatus Zixiibacteriota bacterium]|nr:MAG: GAF domain-containing protein [candidate division Zixibacteria bacterium]
MPSRRKRINQSKTQAGRSGKTAGDTEAAVRRPGKPGGKPGDTERVPRDWQQTFDAIPHFVALISPDLEIIRINRAGGECLGKSAEEVIGKSCCECVHGQRTPVDGCPCPESIRTRKPKFGELRIGEKQFVATASPVLDDDGEPTALIHTIRDITDRKHQERELKRHREQLEELVKERTTELRAANEQLQSQIAERKRAEEEIQRSYHIQSVLNELLHLSLESISLEEVLERAIDHIVSVSWLATESRGCIFLVEDKPEELVMKAERGLAPQLQTECARVAFGRCLCGRAAKSGQIQFAGNVDERHDIRYRGMGPHGHYCVPIMSSDRKVLGVFTLYLKEDHPRDEKEEEFLNAAAYVLAGIIERRRAEETIIETAEQLKIEREALERKNIALGEIMERIDSEKDALKRQLVTNVEQAIIPTLLRLKKSSKSFQEPIFEMLEKDLREIVSPFVDTLSQDHAKLSPRELEVSRLIKNGMTSKEIAEALNLSLLTVYKYRDLIRKKLGLVKDGTNLRTYLRSL